MKRSRRMDSETTSLNSENGDRSRLQPDRAELRRFGAAAAWFFLLPGLAAALVYAMGWGGRGWLYAGRVGFGGAALLMAVRLAAPVLLLPFYRLHRAMRRCG